MQCIVYFQLRTVPPFQINADGKVRYTVQLTVKGSSDCLQKSQHVSTHIFQKKEKKEGNRGSDGLFQQNDIWIISFPDRGIRAYSTAQATKPNNIAKYWIGINGV